jgi:hypothetical protein
MTFIIYRPSAWGIRRNITLSDDISQGEKFSKKQNILRSDESLKGHSTPRTSVAHIKALYEPTLK